MDDNEDNTVKIEDGKDYYEMDIEESCKNCTHWQDDMDDPNWICPHCSRFQG